MYASWDNSRKLASILVATVLIMGTCACQKGNKLVTRTPGGLVTHGPGGPVAPPPAPVTPPPTPFSVVGSFQTDCLDNGDGTYYRSSLTFTASRFTYSSWAFANAGCNDEPTDSYTGSGPYTVVQAESSVGNGAHNINMTFEDDNSRFYSIVRLDGNSLYIGDTTGGNNGSSEATRPTTLNGYEVYQR